MGTTNYDWCGYSLHTGLHNGIRNHSWSRELLLNITHQLITMSYSTDRLEEETRLDLRSWLVINGFGPKAIAIATTKPNSGKKSGRYRIRARCLDGAEAESVRRSKPLKAVHALDHLDHLDVDSDHTSIWESGSQGSDGSISRWKSNPDSLNAKHHSHSRWRHNSGGNLSTHNLNKDEWPTYSENINAVIISTAITIKLLPLIGKPNLTSSMFILNAFYVVREAAQPEVQQVEQWIASLQTKVSMQLKGSDAQSGKDARKRPS